MPYDQSLAEKIRTHFSDQFVVEKKMFGGLAFMVNGKMCITVNNRPDHIMMIRVASDNKEVLQKQGASQAIMNGRKMNGWIFLDKSAVSNQKDLDYWIEIALEFNQQLTTKE